MALGFLSLLLIEEAPSKGMGYSSHRCVRRQASLCFIRSIYSCPLFPKSSFLGSCVCRERNTSFGKWTGRWAMSSVVWVGILLPYGEGLHGPVSCHGTGSAPPPRSSTKETLLPLIPLTIGDASCRCLRMRTPYHSSSPGSKYHCTKRHLAL